MRRESAKLQFYFSVLNIITISSAPAETNSSRNELGFNRCKSAGVNFQIVPLIMDDLSDEVCERVREGVTVYVGPH